MFIECKNCQCYKESVGRQGKGVCRRKSPITGQAWPDVLETEGCGEGVSVDVVEVVQKVWVVNMSKGVSLKGVEAGLKELATEDTMLKVVGKLDELVVSGVDMVEEGGTKVEEVEWK